MDVEAIYIYILWRFAVSKSANIYRRRYTFNSRLWRRRASQEEVDEIILLIWMEFRKTFRNIFNFNGARVLCCVQMITFCITSAAQFVHEADFEPVVLYIWALLFHYWNWKILCWRLPFVILLDPQPMIVIFIIAFILSPSHDYDDHSHVLYVLCYCVSIRGAWCIHFHSHQHQHLIMEIEYLLCADSTNDRDRMRVCVWVFLQYTRRAGAKWYTGLIV